MIIRLIVYILLLFIGIFIGHKEMSHKQILNKVHLLQLGALVLLLFVMGIRIGADQQVMDSLGEIGWKAFAIAFFSIFFSILTVFVYRKIVRINRKGEQK